MLCRENSLRHQCTRALELTSLAGRAEPKLTLAVLTEPVEEKRLEASALPEEIPSTRSTCRTCGAAACATEA